jgi:hypothetical protein
MSIKKTVLSTHAMIRNTLLIVPLSLVLAVFFLREGIAIDSLKLGHFQVQGLYLKLDKKLIAKIRYLQIPKGKTSLDVSELEKQLDRLKAFSKYFQYIALDDVVLTNDHYRILYQSNVVYVSNNEYEVAVTIQRTGDVIEGAIPFFYAKRYKLRLKGSYHYDYRNNNISVKGKYTISGIAGQFEAKQRDERIHFHLDTHPFKDIKPLLNILKADADTHEWLGDRIKARSWQILSLDGTLEKASDGYALVPMSLAGKARIKIATVRFEDKLKPVALASSNITLKKDVLYFGFKKPTYAKRSLSGTTLYLTNLLGTQPTRIHLELKAKSRYDKVVAKVLKVYDIRLPLVQRSGTSKSTISLNIMARTGAADFKGRTQFGKGEIDLSGMPIRVFGGEVSFDAKRVTLHSVDADMGWLRAAVSGTLKPGEKTANLTANVKQMLVGDKKDPFLLMKNKRNVPVKINWKKNTRIDLPLYKTRIVLGKQKGYTLTCSDIRPIIPYLRGLPPSIKSGSAVVKTSDNKRYRFSGKMAWPASYLYEKKGPITVFPFSGTYQKKGVSLSLLNGRILYDGAKKEVKIKRLYIDGKKVLEQNKKRGSKATKVQVKGTQTLIRYEKYVLLTDRFSLRVNGKNTVFVATKDGDSVRVELNGNAIVVKAHRIKASMLRALVNFGGLSGGHYSLDLHGNMKGTMRGVITIDGGVVSSFKTYNNMIALFNTVPALTTLSDPGFSKNGFEVRKGRIEFRVVNNRVYFDMIYIDGKSAAISGKGTVSTLNGAINMDLAVRTARGIGKIIGSLPIVGYILMGKDKSITTGVKVSGTLENPKVTTNVVMETLLAPFEIFTRVLRSPAHIINE